MSATFWRQRENGAVEVTFERRTAQVSDIHVRFSSCVIICLIVLQTLKTSPSPSSAVLFKLHKIYRATQKDTSNMFKISIRQLNTHQHTWCHLLSIPCDTCRKTPPLHFDMRRQGDSYGLHSHILWCLKMNIVEDNQPLKFGLCKDTLFLPAVAF